jgi:hypothetical protein
MKTNPRVRLAALVLVAGGGLMALASPAHAAASANGSGVNCRGVVLSYFATSGMSPGQLHHQFGVSAKDVQASSDAICSL